jgi:glycine/D-amino acid oxidase-like deaminating enzyme
MQSLWSASATGTLSLPELSGPATAQAVVIGAGYTGLSAALHLGEAGRDVVVLEAATLGEGGSGLNGGQVIPGVKLDPDALERMFGPTLGPRVVDTVGSAADLVFELIHRHGIDCDSVRSGWIQSATSPSALEAMQSRVRQWQRRGAPVELLDRRQLAQLLGSERYCGGWLDRRAGTVQPLSYLFGLAAAARRQGTRIFTSSPAIRLERGRQAWCVHTPRGQISSAAVIVATNACSGALLDELRRSVVAVPSVQVATQPLPPPLRDAILPQRQAVSDSWHLLRYYRICTDGRLVMGSRGLLGEASMSRAARYHYRAVQEIFPQLQGLRYEYHWGGMVAMTRDHLPHLHQLAPGLTAGLGYNGRGIAMATVMGRLLARRLLGVADAELGFPVSPLRPMVLHRFSRIGVRLAIQYLRMVDGLARSRDRLMRARSTA